MISRLNQPVGLWYYGAAFLYTAAGYVLGWIGLFQASWLINAAAVLLLGHAMIIAAYLIHECGHNLIFRNIKDNAKLGRALSWLCGSSYGTYEDIRYKHFRHHVDVDDVAWFDYEQFFKDHPLALRVTRMLEWFYIPAHDLIMHLIMVFTSFVIPRRRDQRRRNVTVIIIRGGIFIALLILFPKVASLYAIAYLLMMTVLRFMDSLQHEYDYNPVLFSDDVPPHRGDRVFEQEHTFSNPHSFDHEWLNWFTLNFGFHNAHHARPNTPWFRLPALHRELFGDDPSKVIPLWPQLVVFHRYRVRRIVGDAASASDAEPWGRAFLDAARAAKVTGGNAASFLTPF